MDSNDVLEKAFKVFACFEITGIIVIANNFIHRGAVESIVRSAGFKVMKTKIPAVGFDPSTKNLQWWCKGPIRFVIYLGIQAFGKVTHLNLRGIGEKSATP